MIELHITREEVQCGTISPGHLEEAVRAIREDGFLILHNIIDPTHVQVLQDKMREDTQRILGGEGVFKDWNRNNGNFSQRPPPMLPWLFKDILDNPIATSIAATILGKEIQTGLYSSNVNIPGAVDQQVHVDQSPRKAEDPVGYPCNCIVSNVALIDFTFENGATEIWPGTHMLPCEVGSRAPSEAQLAQRRPIAPPIRACMKRGGYLMRDIRLWHRGRGNTTKDIRTMVCMIQNGSFDPKTDSVEKIPSLGTFPTETRSFFDQTVVRFNPKYVEGAVDYLTGSQK